MFLLSNTGSYLPGRPTNKLRSTHELLDEALAAGNELFEPGGGVDLVEGAARVELGAVGEGHPPLLGVEVVVGVLEDGVGGQDGIVWPHHGREHLEGQVHR